MFKGTTTIEMNLATVMEAMQEYLDKRVDHDEVPQFSVTCVAASGGMDTTFKITIEEKQKPHPLQNAV